MGTALLSFEETSCDLQPTRLLQMPSGLMTVHADSTDTNGQFALLEMEGGPGAEPPMHIHQHEDEFFFVLEGTLKVFRGAEEITLKAGESGFLPRLVPHTFQITSPQARFLVYITPGGFEGYFRGVGRRLEQGAPLEESPAPDVPQMMRVAAHFGITFVR